MLRSFNPKRQADRAEAVAKGIRTIDRAIKRLRRAAKEKVSND